MANISDYLTWRGDIAFYQDPFNEVDNLVLAELVYTNFAGIVPGRNSEESISIQEAYEKFWELHTEEEILDSNSTTKMAPFLLKQLAESRRFGKMRLRGYVNEIDFASQSQFSVVTFLLEDDTAYVAYRGTDNTIVGWKEDFNMAFLDHTPGQIAAVNYLDEQSIYMPMDIRVGGHSKGGNFAVFASAFCQESVQDSIIAVYSNDGPGFSEGVSDEEGYKRILSRVISTVPESSIVGMLLENDLKHKVVLSSEKGAMQHDAMSWQVERNHFVEADQLSDTSLVLDETLKNWIFGLGKEQREQFVSILFDTITASGAVTLDDIFSNKVEFVTEAAKALRDLSKEQQKQLREVLRHLAVSGTEAITNKFKK